MTPVLCRILAIMGFSLLILIQSLPAHAGSNKQVTTATPVPTPAISFVNPPHDYLSGGVSYASAQAADLKITGVGNYFYLSLQIPGNTTAAYGPTIVDLTSTNEFVNNDRIICLFGEANGNCNGWPSTLAEGSYWFYAHAWSPTQGPGVGTNVHNWGYVTFSTLPTPTATVATSTPTLVPTLSPTATRTPTAVFTATQTKTPTKTWTPGCPIGAYPAPGSDQCVIGTPAATGTVTLTPTMTPTPTPGTPEPWATCLGDRHSCTTMTRTPTGTVVVVTNPTPSPTASSTPTPQSTRVTTRIQVYIPFS